MNAYNKLVMEHNTTKVLYWLLHEQPFIDELPCNENHKKGISKYTIICFSTGEIKHVTYKAMADEYVVVNNNNNNEDVKHEDW